MNKYLLEYEIKKKGYTVDDVCKAVGISKSAFYRKMNQTTEFTRSEIEKIVNFLDLESPVPIFFADVVS